MANPFVENASQNQRLTALGGAEGGRKLSSARTRAQRFIATVQARWIIAVVSVACLAVLTYFSLRANEDSATAGAAENVATAHAAVPESTSDGASEAVRVEIVKPGQQGLGRKTTQPGSVHAFQYAQLFAKTSGYLGEQHVDIGDHVKQGQLLARIDVPELERDVEEASASLKRAQSVVAQMTTRVQTARAEAAAAAATIKQMEAEVVRTAAQRTYREKEFHRMEELYELKSIDKRLVDEKEDAAGAARAAELGAEASVENAKAQAEAATARIAQAKADVEHAQADVQVAEAVLAKAKVMWQYTRIESPYDGVVTLRKYHPGAFIQAADRGEDQPLLTVARTDPVRVVVQVPDRDVPFTQVGDEATVEIDALPNQRFTGKVSRVADVEDPQTRTMRVEIDLPNDRDLLREGMYGRVTIQLEPPSADLTIPSSALVGKTTDGKGKVYIVRDGKALLVPIQIDRDDGLNMEVGTGLQPTDDVVVHYRGAIGDGTPVTVAAAASSPPAAH